MRGGPGDGARATVLGPISPPEARGGGTGELASVVDERASQGAGDASRAGGARGDTDGSGEGGRAAGGAAEGSTGGSAGREGGDTGRWEGMAADGGDATRLGTGRVGGAWEQGGVETTHEEHNKGGTGGSATAVRRVALTSSNTRVRRGPTSASSPLPKPRRMRGDSASPPTKRWEATAAGVGVGRALRFTRGVPALRALGTGDNCAQQTACKPAGMGGEGGDRGSGAHIVRQDGGGAFGGR